jgi:hypothetical protein
MSNKREIQWTKKFEWKIYTIYLFIYLFLSNERLYYKISFHRYIAYFFIEFTIIKISLIHIDLFQGHLNCLKIYTQTHTLKSILIRLKTLFSTGHQIKRVCGYNIMVITKLIIHYGYNKIKKITNNQMIKIWSPDQHYTIYNNNNNNNNNNFLSY